MSQNPVGPCDAHEAFAGQRALLQQVLTPAQASGQPVATALVALRLDGDGSQPECLLLGTDAKQGAQITLESRFELGSVTKALAGSLLARLAARGTLGLDDAVERWMPALAGTPAGGLALRSLATHRSGLPRLPRSLRMLASILRDPDDPYRHFSEADMLAWLRGWRGEKRPGFAYSNLGFALLGLVLERVTGQPLARAMETEILIPAGADGAGLDEALAAGQIQGHDPRGQPVPAWTCGPFAAAGGLRANARQMLALLDAARQRRAPFDTGADRRQALRDDTGTHAVALGWMRTEKHGERIVWHNGATGGFRSFLGYSEVSGRGVVLMANGRVDLDGLGMQLISSAFAAGTAPVGAGRMAWAQRPWVWWCALSAMGAALLFAWVR